MTTHYSSRLAYLMDSLGVTGRDLANALHVDYSLVSKWRNNSRRLSNRSNHLKKTAEHLLLLDEAVDYLHIRRALNGQYEDSHTIPYEALLRYLCRWLSESASPGDYASIIGSDKSQNAYTSHFDVYGGNHGRRCAVIRFLDYVLTMPTGQELFLLSQEDMSWMLEDREFLVAWENKLTQSLARKNTITIVHTLDREFKDLTLILAKWLPLHMTGLIKSYFHPRYVDTKIKHTMFLLKNSFVILGNQPGHDQESRYTACFTDPATIKQSEAVYHAFLSECRPLFTSHPMKPVDKLLQMLLEAQDKSDNTYLYSPFPALTTMPEQTLAEILEANDAADNTKGLCMEYFAASQRSFLQNLRTFSARHIYNLATLQQAITTLEPVVSPDLSLIAGKPIIMTQNHLRAHIRSLLTLLQREDNFSLGFSTSNAQVQLPDIGLWVQESGVALSSTMVNSQYGPFYLMADEPTMVSAFYAFCDNMWLSLPRVNREKKQVVEKLKRLL